MIIRSGSFVLTFSSTVIFSLHFFLQNRSWTRFNPKPKVDPALKEHWDPSKSAEVNLASFGLVAQPNKLPNQSAAQGSATDPLASKKDAVIELFDVPESDKPSWRTRFPLTLEEEKYMARCMAKYGDDYTRMFRDTKVNNMQHTEHMLRKLGSRFLLLSPAQRQMEIPDKVQPLLPRIPADLSE